MAVGDAGRAPGSAAGGPDQPSGQRRGEGPGPAAGLRFEAHRLLIPTLPCCSQERHSRVSAGGGGPPAGAPYGPCVPPAGQQERASPRPRGWPGGYAGCHSAVRLGSWQSEGCTDTPRGPGSPGAPPPCFFLCFSAFPLNNGASARASAARGLPGAPLGLSPAPRACGPPWGRGAWHRQPCLQGRPEASLTPRSTCSQVCDLLRRSSRFLPSKAGKTFASCLARSWRCRSYYYYYYYLCCLFSLGTVLKGGLQSRKTSIVCHRKLEILLETPFSPPK